MRAPSMKPVTPYIAPARVWTITVVQNTLTPETLAASALEPTANMFLPKAVLFQMNHISATKITAYSTYHGMEIFAPEPVVNWIMGAETTLLYS